MGRHHLKALALAAGAAAALLPTTVPAGAAEANAAYGQCTFASVADPSDPQGTTWVEGTAAVFTGTPDVTSFEVTCWLQMRETYVPGDTGNGALPTTQHTCEDSTPVGRCLNPTVYAVDSNGTPLYQCTHVRYTDTRVVVDATGAGTNPGAPTTGSLIFTGGTVGSTQPPVTNPGETTGSAIFTNGSVSPTASPDTGPSFNVTVGNGAQAVHTATVDYDSSATGVQCQVVERV